LRQYDPTRGIAIGHFRALLPSELGSHVQPANPCWFDFAIQLALQVKVDLDAGLDPADESLPFAVGSHGVSNFSH